MIIVLCSNNTCDRAKYCERSTAILSGNQYRRVLQCNEDDPANDVYIPNEAGQLFDILAKSYTAGKPDFSIFSEVNGYPCGELILFQSKSRAGRSKLGDNIQVRLYNDK